MLEKNKLNKRLISAWQLIIARLAQLWRFMQSSLPNRCLLCQQSIAQFGYQQLFPQTLLKGVCQPCLAANLYQAEACLGCGRLMTRLMMYCGQCQQTQPMVVIAPCSYHDGLAPIITAIKYQQQFAGLLALMQQLLRRIQQLQRLNIIRLPQALIPVPLHVNRQRQRGFNQAGLIAHWLGQQLSITVLENIIIKTVDTPPQAQLSGMQRRKLTQLAYRLVADVTYQRVAIIDDVVTSGATVEAIETLLLPQGVHCQAWALARAEAPKLRSR
ncbi:ComF family protein [Shewanella intestini]|uniref:ComF family protein n=2 Tax=Shewanellaceae TaxID=267890 RepID=A0ABS5I2F1_9GAMM|nr:ComF family protein [Shewanella intestini]